MLPGFRFLFTAIVLSMSILIFGLGAAALLRAAHEEFANLPARRAPPQPMFARQNDDQPPTLALLRVDTPTENAPAAAAPETAIDVPAPASQAPVESEKLAALTPAEPAQAEAAKPEAPAREASAETPIATSSATATESPAPNAEVQIAAIAATPEPAAATPPAASSEPASDIPPFESSIATTLIATLGGPAVIIEEKPANARPDHSVGRQRAVQRARERRRVIAARRARLAREAVLTLQQQQPNPFTPFPGMPATR
jgi:hypothetical protein